MMQPTQPDLPTLTTCPEITCIEAQGADAVEFLQSQLTQDVQITTQSKAALAGYCTPKGRLLATMVLAPGLVPGDVRLLVRTDLIEGFLKRLRMFVLRSKVTLTVRDDLTVLGLNWAAQSAPANWPKLPDTIWQTLQDGQAQIIRAPSAQDILARAWLIRPSDEPLPFEASLSHSENSLWQAQDVLAGMPWIAEATRDLFIPQSLNMDLIDGVSFSKGCFPGQEVVARAHYRTQVKRRMHGGQTVEANAAIEAGADIVEIDTIDRPVGRVVQAATCADQSTVLLFEAPMDKLDPNKLAVLTTEGPRAFALIELPYSTVTQ